MDLDSEDSCMGSNSLPFAFCLLISIIYTVFLGIPQDILPNVDCVDFLLLADKISSLGPHRVPLSDPQQLCLE